MGFLLSTLVVSSWVGGGLLPSASSRAGRLALEAQRLDTPPPPPLASALDDAQLRSELAQSRVAVAGITPPLGEGAPFDEVTPVTLRETDLPPRVTAARLDGTGLPTVWSEFGELASSMPDAVNLGQGFPDWQPPAFVLEQAQEALATGFNQYTRPAGHPPLVEVLARRYSKHLGREIDPATEVAVTVGASQALYLTLQALVDPGDEVILLEPAFDLYYGQVKLAGGTAVPVPLKLGASDPTADPTADSTGGGLNSTGGGSEHVVAGRGEVFSLDIEALEASITPKSKVLVLNSPHNPTGKAFTSGEMEAIADVVRRHPQLLVISDEVYKYIVHSGEPHVHFASFPGMFERTVTLSSAGKTFSITGWQSGWCVGPPRLLKPIQLLLPFVQFCVATPMQQALSRVLTLADEPYEGHDSYYEWLCDMYRRKRALLAEGLRGAGIVPLDGEGGFFLMGDTRGLNVPEKYLRESTAAAPQMTRDWAVCRWFAIEAGVIAIPASPFYSGPNKALAQNLVRFAFCKSDQTILEACERLSRLSRAD